MENQNNQAGNVLLPALYRLSLLVIPVAAAICLCGSNPLLCIILCAVILTTWLCVDAGPFSAGAAKAAKKPLIERIQDVAKPQALAGHAIKAMIFVSLFHSRLMV
jgi:hypothetical protein